MAGDPRNNLDLPCLNLERAYLRCIQPSRNGISRHLDYTLSARRRWEDITSTLGHYAHIGLPLKRLVLEGMRIDEGQFREINELALHHAAESVEEVLDCRSSINMPSELNSIPSYGRYY